MDPLIPASGARDPREPLTMKWWAAIYPEFNWERRVSGGGDEKVYRARFGPQQQSCLLLPLSPDRFPTPVHLQHFLSKMQAVQQVEHPALLKILGVAGRNGTACVCYEDFAGEPLQEVLLRQPKAPFSVRAVATVALGLHAAHLRGITHWDVNAAWILVNLQGDSKILGVGIAPLIYPTKHEFYEACLRRPPAMRAYVAPEQLKEESETPISVRTDIYSLGALAYHLLTGVPLGGYVVLPSSRKEVGTFTDNVVFTATLGDPNARQPSAEKFARDISRIGGGIDNSYLELLDPEEQQRVLKARREKRRNLLLASVGGFALVVMIGLSFYQPKPPEGGTASDAGTMDLTTHPTTALRDLIAKERKEEAIAVISVLMQKMVALDWRKDKTDELEELAPLAIQLGQEETLLNKTTQLLNELPSDSPDLERIGLLVSLLKEGSKNHHAAMALAKQYREQGQNELARNELAKAQAFLPNHPCIAQELALLNYDGLTALRNALKQARLPGGDPIAFAVNEAGVELHVDLANNRDLKDLSFLKGQPITHLDLSNTGVSDLESIAELPLQVLHLDDTAVQDLRPLRSLSLRLLTAEGNEILEKGIVTKSIFLTNYRLGLPLQKTLAKTDRAQRKRLWVNQLGMRFSPLKGSETVLFADWETRYGDFESFAEETKLPVNPGMMCREESGTWKTLPFSWSDPPGEQSLVDPVVGITFNEANRFCDWLTRKAREKSLIPPAAKFRLPTSAEWTQATGLISAAEPTSNVLYPWGNEWPPPLTAGNYPHSPTPETAPKVPRPFTTPVGRFRNLCPHRDMGGNVREWCLNEAKKPVLRDTSCQEDLRDFPTPQEAFKLEAETTLPPEARDSTVGFRVVLDFGLPAS